MAKYGEFFEKNKINLEVDNILNGRSFFRKSNYKKVLDDIYFYLVILNDGNSYGFSYYNKTKKETSPIKYINKNPIKTINKLKNLPLKVAMLDSIAGKYNEINKIKPNYRIYYKGDMKKRAEIRSKELTKGIKKNEKVLLVGAVSEIVK